MASRLRLRYLVLLLQVARQGSLTRAAEALGFSQPAASKALKELESLFGAPLFLRGANGLTPTALGMLALRRARDLFQDMDNWEHEAEAVLTGSLAHLNIGAIPSVSGHLLATAIERVHARHNVTISLHRATSDQLIGLLRQHELDGMTGRATVVEAGDDFSQQAPDCRHGLDPAVFCHAHGQDDHRDLRPRRRTASVSQSRDVFARRY